MIRKKNIILMYKFKEVFICILNFNMIKDESYKMEVVFYVKWKYWFFFLKEIYLKRLMMLIEIIKIYYKLIIFYI